jgi:hypothetical protein
MDRDDQEHFRTIAAQSAKRLTDSPTPADAASYHSRLDQAYCLSKAKAICGCYRRDEAQDAEAFAAALAIILADYSKTVVDYVADPRTGTIVEFPNGLPNVGQIREFCDIVVRRANTLSKPKSVAVPYVPPPLRPGQIDSATFNKFVAEGKTYPRPVGPFEKVDDKWNKDLHMRVKQAEGGASFEEANKQWLNENPK